MSVVVLPGQPPNCSFRSSWSRSDFSTRTSITHDAQALLMPSMSAMG